MKIIEKFLGEVDVRPAGSFAVLTPVPEPSEKTSFNWMPSKKERRELRLLAERLAHKDAVARTKRRRQL
ncbi:MAG: hypothetical protein N3G77_07530 [Nitrososphaeria archaeon]|nr:hypothetical protein [Nitrososphaeria archaeon]